MYSCSRAGVVIMFRCSFFFFLVLLYFLSASRGPYADFVQVSNYFLYRPCVRKLLYDRYQMYSSMLIKIHGNVSTIIEVMYVLPQTTFSTL